MLCYAMLCYAMLCYAMQVDAFVRAQPAWAQAQALVCARTGRRLVVVNTHLIMHSLAAGVRAVQAHLSSEQLDPLIAPLA